MKVSAFIAVLSLGVASAALAVMPQAGTVTKYVTVDGDVVRYEPGRVIVIRGTDNKETIYTLQPNVAIPADVKVGRRVTLYTEPGRDGGTQLVSRVTTTSVTAEGNIKRTTEDTRTLPSGATSTTTTTTIEGRVASYVAGKTLTISRADGSRVTYLLTEKSNVPGDLAIGKTVSIVPLVGSAEPVAQTITYVTVRERP